LTIHIPVVRTIEEANTLQPLLKMSNLQIKTQSDLLAFLKDNLSDGQNLSIRGVAKLCGVQNTSLIRSSAFNSEKLGQILTDSGFEAVALEQNGFNAKATWLVIEYFAYESKAKAEGAKQIARTFGQLGIQLTFDKLAEVKQPQLPQSFAEALRLAADLQEENERQALALTEAAPKIEFCDRVEASPELCTMGDYLKAQGWGRTLGFKELRDLGVIQKQSNLPYQHWIKAGYFTIHTNILGIQSARITGRGQVWLSAQLSIPTEPEIIQKKRGKDGEDYLAARCQLELKGSKVTQRDLAGILNLTEQSVRNNTAILFGSWENFLNDDFDN
jgi:phage antirepressor YoqD-like protein